jgi:hypothetical protein
MDEGRKGIIHRGVGAYLPYAARSLPQYISAFATRVLQSTYVCVKGKREPEPEFSNFSGPQLHQFHGIGRLVSETLYLLNTVLALPVLHMH